MLDFTDSVCFNTKEESMAIKLSLGPIEVTCDTPEEAMVLAGAASQLKPPKASDMMIEYDRRARHYDVVD
jgi:hypothetical protein